MRKRLIGFGMAGLLALGLAAGAEARVGGYGAWTNKLVFSSEGEWSYVNGVATASVFTASTLSKNTLADGSVIVIEAAGNVTVNSTPTLAIAASYGGTAMLSSTFSPTAGSIVIRAVGVVRSTGTSGTILWSLYIYNDASSDATTFVVDATADAFDNSIPDQDLGLSFTWGTVHSSNDLLIEQMNVWYY